MKNEIPFSSFNFLPRHRDISSDEGERIKAVWQRLERIYPRHASLEDFEKGFMQDVTPYREVTIWENILTACEKVIEKANFSNQSDEQIAYFKRQLLVTCLSISSGGYTDEQLNENNFLGHCYMEWHSASNLNPAPK